MALSFAEEGALIARAVAEMTRQGVAATPKKLEEVLNAVALAGDASDLTQGRVVTSVGLTPRHPDGSGGELVKRIRVGPRATALHADPVPYFKLNARRRAELEADAEALAAKIAAPGLDPVVRDKLRQDLRKVQDELGMDRNAPPQRSSSLPGRGYDRPTGA